jgi:hypothetical protein
MHLALVGVMTVAQVDQIAVARGLQVGYLARKTYFAILDAAESIQ